MCRKKKWQNYSTADRIARARTPKVAVCVTHNASLARSARVISTRESIYQDIPKIIHLQGPIHLNPTTLGLLLSPYTFFYWCFYFYFVSNCVRQCEKTRHSKRRAQRDNPPPPLFAISDCCAYWIKYIIYRSVLYIYVIHGATASTSSFITPLWYLYINYIAIERGDRLAINYADAN